MRPARIRELKMGKIVFVLRSAIQNVEYTKCIAILLILAGGASCSDDNASSDDNVSSDDNEKYVMWTPCPIATIDDGAVQLNWLNYSIYNKILLPFEWVSPDKFDIYISESETSKFRKLIELKNDESYSYTSDKLQNGKPYLFYVVSKKNGFKSLYSDTVMAVPNKRKEFEILQISNDLVHTLWNVSIARQKNKIAYVDQYIWDCTASANGLCMDHSVFISNIDGSEKELVGISGRNPHWSPANDKIVYWSEKGHVQTIELYDCETKSNTRLTVGNDRNLAPVFSGNGEFLLFQSSKNAPDKYTTNIWLFNLKTFDSFQITDISKTSLRTVEYPYCIDNDRFLFHGIYPGEKYQLFESSVSKKQINKVFSSKWNDCTPSISPDQTKIAFISDRTRIYQIWIYHIVSKTYSQITGYSNGESIGQYTNIEWVDNSTIMYTIYSNEGLQLVKQRVE